MVSSWDANKALLLLETLDYGASTFTIQNENTFMDFVSKLPTRIFGSTPFKRQMSLSKDTINYTEEQLVTYFCSLVFMLTEAETEKLLKEDLKNFSSNLKFDQSLIERLNILRSEYFKIRRNDWDLLSQILLKDIDSSDPFHSKSQKIVDGYINSGKIYETITSHIASMNLWYPTGFGLDKLPIFPNAEDQQAFYSSHLHSWVFEYLSEVVFILNVLISLVCRRVLLNSIELPELFCTLFINGFEQISSIISEISSTLTPFESEEIKSMVKEINFKSIILVVESCQFWRTFNSEADTKKEMEVMGGITPTISAYLNKIFRMAHAKSSSSIFFSSTIEIMAFFVEKFTEVALEIPYQETNDLNNIELIAQSFVLKNSTLPTLSFDNLSKDIYALAIFYFGPSSILDIQNKPNYSVIATIFQEAINIIIRHRTLVDYADLTEVVDLCKLAYNNNEVLCDVFIQSWVNPAIRNYYPLAQLLINLANHSTHFPSSFIRLISTLACNPMMIETFVNLLDTPVDLTTYETPHSLLYFVNNKWVTYAEFFQLNSNNSLLNPQNINIKVKYNYNTENPNVFALYFNEGSLIEATVNDNLFVINWNKKYNWWTIMLYYLTSFNSIFLSDTSSSYLDSAPNSVESKKELIDHTRLVVTSALDLIKNLSHDSSQKNYILKKLNSNWNRVSFYLILLQYGGVEHYEQLSEMNIIPSITLLYSNQDLEKHFLSLNISRAVTNDLVKAFSRINLLDDQDNLSFLKFSFSRILSKTLINQLVISSYKLDQNGLYINSKALNLLNRSNYSTLELDIITLQFIEILETIYTISQGQLIISLDLLQEFGTQFGYFNEVSSSDASQIVSHHSLFRILLAVSYNCSPAHCFKIKTTLINLASCLYENCHSTSCYIYAKLQIISQYESINTFSNSLSVVSYNDLLSNIDNIISTSESFFILQNQMNSFLNSLSLFIINELNEIPTVDVRINHENFKSYFLYIDTLLNLLFNIINKSSKHNECYYIKAMLTNSSFLQLILMLATLLPSLTLQSKYFINAEKSKTMKDLFNDNNQLDDMNHHLPLNMKILLNNVNSEAFYFVVKSSLNLMLKVSTTSINILYNLLSSSSISSKELTSNLVKVLITPCSLLTNLSFFTSLQFSSNNSFTEYNINSGPVSDCSYFCALLSLINLHLESEEVEACRVLRLATLKLTSNLISIFPINVQSFSFINALGSNNIEGFNSLLITHLSSDYTSMEEVYYIWSLLSRIAEFHPDILCLLLSYNSLSSEIMNVLQDSTRLYDENPLIVYFVLSFIRHLILKSKDFPILKKTTLKLALESKFFDSIMQPLLLPPPVKFNDELNDFITSSKFNAESNTEVYEIQKEKEVLDHSKIDQMNDKVMNSCYKTLVLSKCLQILSMERYGLLNALDRDDGKKITDIVTQLLSSDKFKVTFSSWIKNYLSIQYDNGLVNNFKASLVKVLNINWSDIQSLNLINFLSIGKNFAVQTNVIKNALNNSSNYFELTSYQNDTTNAGLSIFFCDKISHLYNESIGMNFILSITSCDLQLLNYYHEFLNVFIIPRNKSVSSLLPNDNFYNEKYSYDIVQELMSTILLSHKQILSKQDGLSLPSTYLGLITVNEKVSLLMTMLHHQLREIQFKDLIPEQSLIEIRNFSASNKCSLDELDKNLNSLIDLYSSCFDNDNDILIEYFNDEMDPSADFSYPKKNSIPVSTMVSPTSSHVNSLKLQIRIKLLTIILYSLTTLIDSNRNYSLRNKNLIKIFDSSLKLQQKIFEVYGLDVLKSMNTNNDLYSTLNDCGITKKDIQSLIQLTFQLINLTLPSLKNFDNEEFNKQWMDLVESSQLSLYLVRLFNQLSISNANYPYDYCQFLNSPNYKYDIIENIVRSKITLPLKRNDSSSNSNTNKNNAISLFDYIEVDSDKKIIYNEGISSLQYIILIFTKLIESNFITLGSSSFEYLLMLLTHIIDSPLFSNLIHVLYAQLNIGTYDLKSSINTLLDIVNAQVLAPLLGYNSVNFEEDLLFKLWENILILLERVIILNSTSGDLNNTNVINVITSLIQRHYLLFLLPLCLSTDRRYSLRQLDLIKLTFNFFNVINTYIPLWSVYVKEFYLIVKSLTKGLISDWINLLTFKNNDEVSKSSDFLKRFIFVSSLEYKNVNNIVSKISDDLLNLSQCNPKYDLLNKNNSNLTNNLTKSEMSISLYYENYLYQNILILMNFLRQILPLPVEHYDLNHTITVGSNVFFMSNNTNTLMQGTVSRIYNTNQAPVVSTLSDFTYNNNNFIEKYNENGGNFNLYDIVLTNQLLERGVSLSQIRYVNYPLCDFITEKKLDEIVISKTPYVSDIKKTPNLYLAHNPNDDNSLESKYYLTTAHLYKFIKFVLSDLLQKRLQFFDKHSEDLLDYSQLLLMESLYLLIANLDHHSFAPNYREKEMLVVVEDLLNSSYYHISGSQAINSPSFVGFSTWVEWNGYSNFCRHWLEEIEFRLRRSLGVTIYYNEELVITPNEKGSKKRIGLRGKVEWVRSGDDL